MAVDDHGLEAIRKSAEELTPGDKSEYRIRTTATGTFTASGLFTDIRTTTLDVSTTAIKLPASPLADRNSLEIHNLGSSTLYIGKDNTVTADAVIGTTSGKEIDGGSFWSIDITEDIELYGIVASGTVRIKVTEVS